MNAKALAITLLLTSAAVSGCGRMGDLERPAPAGAAMNARSDATATGQQYDDNGDPRTGSENPVNRHSDVNRDIDPAPPRTLPLEGLPSNPSEVAPQGALPDPYANPQ
jgi:predicted small lipoprotein YifL